jgi:hypothetical protein
MTAKTDAPVIVWFRKDLRTDDNAALVAAAVSANRRKPAPVRWVRRRHGGCTIRLPRLARRFGNSARRSRCGVVRPTSC